MDYYKKYFQKEFDNITYISFNNINKREQVLMNSVFNYKTFSSPKLGLYDPIIFKDEPISDNHDRSVIPEIKYFELGPNESQLHQEIGQRYSSNYALPCPLIHLIFDYSGFLDNVWTVVIYCPDDLYWLHYTKYKLFNKYSEHKLDYQIHDSIRNDNLEHMKWLYDINNGFVTQVLSERLHEIITGKAVNILEWMIVTAKILVPELKFIQNIPFPVYRWNSISMNVLKKYYASHEIRKLFDHDKRRHEGERIFAICLRWNNIDIVEWCCREFGLTFVDVFGDMKQYKELCTNLVKEPYEKTVLDWIQKYFKLQS